MALFFAHYVWSIQSDFYLFLSFCHAGEKTTKTLVIAVEVWNTDLELIHQGGSTYLSIAFHYSTRCSGGPIAMVTQGIKCEDMRVILCAPRKP